MDSISKKFLEFAALRENVFQYGQFPQRFSETEEQLFFGNFLDGYFKLKNSGLKKLFPPIN